MPAPATSSRHLYTGHRRGHIQAAPRLRTHRGEPLSRDHPQIPVSMPSLFRFDASAVVHTCSSSHRTPAPLTARRQPQRSPPRLLTDAACGGLESPPARRPRRTHLHHWHSTDRADDLLHHRHHFPSGHTWVPKTVRDSLPCIRCPRGVLRADQGFRAPSLRPPGPHAGPASVLAHSQCSLLAVLPLAVGESSGRFSCSMPAPAMTRQVGASAPTVAGPPTDPDAALQFRCVNGPCSAAEFPAPTTAPLQGPHRYYGPVRPCAPHRYSRTRSVRCLWFSPSRPKTSAVSIGATGSPDFMPAPATSSRHLYTEHRRGHIQAAPRLRAHRSEPLSQDHPQIPVSMPPLFRFDASAVVHTCSSSHRTPAPLTARRQPQRSPPRLLTDAACGGLPNLRPHGDPAGPTSITGTARIVPTIFYIIITSLQDTRGCPKFGRGR